MRYTRLSLLSALLFMIVACGIDNTMYNAKNYFESAQERALNANGRPTPQAVDEYTKAIQKCGIILSRNSKGKRADDALFLMARALYYKKNSAFQAKDAFENLIAGYPDSKHVPDAYIYLARVLRDVNQTDESEAVLERFIRDSRFKKHHARALLVMADFEIKDKDYSRAQYWLERIIRDYKDSKEFKEAFFLFGKNYYMQKDYQRSLSEFERFIDTRGIPKPQKMEARYYVAANLLDLGRAEEAEKESRYLIRHESRPDLLSKAKVLHARILLALGEEEGGLRALEDVSKDYPRTEHAAAAYYHWGRYLYYFLGDAQTSTSHLNRVRTEFSQSEFAEPAKNLADAISSASSTASPDIKRDLQAFLDFHYKRAESFLGAISLPDSAIAAYKTVISYQDSLQGWADSLQVKLDSLNVQIDSLNAFLPDSTETSVQEKELPVVSLSPDSTDVSLETVDPDATIADSLGAEIQETATLPGKEESVAVAVDADTLAVVDENAGDADLPPTEAEASTEKEEMPMEEIPAPEEDPIAITRDRLEILRQNYGRIEEELQQLTEPLQRFAGEVVPFCRYSIFNILHEIPQREDEAIQIYEELLANHPRNIYSSAAKAVLAGKTPSLVDPALEEAELSFDTALDFYPAHEDSLVMSMQEFTESEFEHLRTRANFRLGWYYSFESPDTSAARPYLDQILENDPNSEYAEAIRRFYDGSVFLKREADYRYYEESAESDSLANAEDPADSTAADSLATDSTPEDDSDAETNNPSQDLLKENSILDSLLSPVEIDSLMAPAEPDSLQLPPVEDDTAESENKDEPGPSLDPLPPPKEDPDS